MCLAGSCQEPGPSSSNMRQRVFGLEEELRHKCEAAAIKRAVTTVRPCFFTVGYRQAGAKLSPCPIETLNVVRCLCAELPGGSALATA